MFNILTYIPLKIKLAIFGLAFLIIIATILVALQTPPEKEPETSIPTRPTIIGKTITPETESKLDITEKTASDEGKTTYSLKSENPVRPDQLITKYQNIVFERIYIPEDPANPNHLLISNLIQKYGNPEKIMSGSKTWGQYISTYIYSSHGVAFIGNPNTNEVYELQYFAPTTIDEYIKNYGDDIDETPHGGES